ncbi:MAG: 50S ribosomal protein L9 [Chloroflexi bacterium 44-23]|nr:MAG: 50S ribosomal protein L9 [Chloroflexi bacterium 44-23]
MKVLLLKDVYKLGRAGDVKKVADGYGRNYLIPQGFALLATPGAMKQADQIRKNAIERRAVLNNELSGVSQAIEGLVLTFASKAGETGKLYGSITNQMIADAINEKVATTIDRRQIEIQPIRNLGEHKALVRLTVDLVPAITVIVHREGEVVKFAKTETKAIVGEPVGTDVVTDEISEEEQVATMAVEESPEENEE